MHLIFKAQSPLKDNLISILKMSFVHARNLGVFVFIYKGLLSAARLLYIALGLGVSTPPGAAARGWHALLAGWIWAIVMWIYEVEPKMLQPSLEASMRYLYTDSNSWSRKERFFPTLASAAILGSVFWMKRKSLADLWDLKKRV
ncbi:hypothetical protein GUITHDRAFT_121939 [Guillardia theta CCMP2712]|uniref:Uncharacterized protein n=1 Tax=Guillardia theta (strain CCMP2712) TaxID=905079 RepID=L1I7N9_GUITC|nr:hypothetical protein GUITHDRAFT_121939 [Guillardia theta CCMP2712]EKX31865.1 hypothetical protein GUITHDRAFT_121939 [Guillardia theta CCMP2712]|eukprot:XP_005818845.1 hypothetical protein GUITHDRAFT_121939 [Guillardia theta CCMP2712]